MEQTIETIQEFLPFITPIVTGIIGTVGGWFLKTLDYNRDKKKRHAHLKAKLLDEILDQCRRIEKKLNGYEGTLEMYQRYLDDEEIDPETGYPKNMFDLHTEPAYRKYINGIEEAKEVLRHRHQNYVIKTKSEEIEILNAIDESLTKLIHYDDSPNFNYEQARTEYWEAYTNLRLIHHDIKDVYPEEVPLN